MKYIPFFLTLFLISGAIAGPSLADTYKPAFTRSLFFSTNELNAIESARQGTLFGPVDNGMSDAQSAGVVNDDTIPPLEEELPEIGIIPRDIRVGGLVYVTADVWTVWVNGLRVSPGNIPDEIVSIRVYPKHVRLRWFDRLTQKIYDVQLKPHQRYNIDSGTMLPG